MPWQWGYGSAQIRVMKGYGPTLLELRRDGVNKFTEKTVTMMLMNWSCTLKPATGRPCVPAYLVSGAVAAFTCDCLRFVCAFMRQR